MRNLYFASCAADGCIHRYSFDPKEDGTLNLQLLQSVPVKNLLYLDISDGELTAVNRGNFPETRHSALFSFALKEDGEIGELIRGPIDVQGVEGCHVSRLNGTLYVANYDSGSLFGTNGAYVKHEGSGPNKFRQSSPHAHFIKPSPDGKYLLAVDLGMDTIFTYDADLREVSRVSAAPGVGPRHLAYSADGKTVFCVNELASSVTAFAYNDGILTPVTTLSSLLTPNASSSGGAIRVYKDYIYSSNRGDDSIACFSYADGELKLLSVTPCGGVSPRDFDFFDDHLFVTNERTDNVTIFKVNGPELTRCAIELMMPNPLSVVSDT